jgi:hypothetical protein
MSRSKSEALAELETFDPDEDAEPDVMTLKDIDSTTLDLTPQHVENFKQVYAEVAKRARTVDPGQAVTAQIGCANVRADRARYVVKITIEIGKHPQQFNH